MEKLRENYKLGTILYSIGVIYLSLYRIETYTMLSELNIPSIFIEGLPYLAFYSLILFKIFFIDRYSKKQIIFFSILVVYSVTNYFICGLFTEPLVIPLLIIGAQNINFRKLIVYYLVVHVLFVLLIILLNILSIIPSPQYTKHGRKIFTLGFSNQNHLASVIFCLFLLITLILRNHKSIYALFGMGLTALVFWATGCRTSCILIVLTTLLFEVFSNIKFLQSNSIILKILNFSFIIVCIISFVLVLTYSNENRISTTIDNFVTGRNHIASNRLKTIKPSFWGNSQETYGHITILRGEAQEFTQVDISYVYLFFRFGAIALILFLLGYFLIGLEAIKEGLWYYPVTFFILSLFYYSESFIIDIGYSPMIVIIGFLFSRPKGRGLNLFVNSEPKD